MVITASLDKSAAVALPETTIENSAKLEFDPPVLFVRLTSSVVEVASCRRKDVKLIFHCVMDGRRLFHVIVSGSSLYSLARF